MHLLPEERALFEQRMIEHYQTVCEDPAQLEQALTELFGGQHTFTCYCGADITGEMVANLSGQRTIWYPYKPGRWGQWRAARRTARRHRRDGIVRHRWMPQCPTGHRVVVELFHH